jgi:hypothetical protein
MVAVPCGLKTSKNALVADGTAKRPMVNELLDSTNRYWIQLPNFILLDFHNLRRLSYSELWLSTNPVRCFFATVGSGSGAREDAARTRIPARIVGRWGAGRGAMT